MGAGLPRGWGAACLSGLLLQPHPFWVSDAAPVTRLLHGHPGAPPELGRAPSATSPRPPCCRCRSLCWSRWLPLVRSAVPFPGKAHTQPGPCSLSHNCPPQADVFGVCPRDPGLQSRGVETPRGPKRAGAGVAESRAGLQLCGHRSGYRGSLAAPSRCQDPVGRGPWCPVFVLPRVGRAWCRGLWLGRGPQLQAVGGKLSAGWAGSCLGLGQGDRKDRDWTRGPPCGLTNKVSTAGVWSAGHIPVPQAGLRSLRW